MTIGNIHRVSIREHWHIWIILSDTCQNTWIEYISRAEKMIGSLERNIFLTQKHSLTLILPVLVHAPEL